MSNKRESAAADLFFALGDRTRLSVVTRLGSTGAQTATALAERAQVSRQAVTKHLQVLAGAGLVSSEKSGREVLYALKPTRLEDARQFLDKLSLSWDHALDRLRVLVEPPPQQAKRTTRK